CSTRSTGRSTRSRSTPTTGRRSSWERGCSSGSGSSPSSGRAATKGGSPRPARPSASARRPLKSCGTARRPGTDRRAAQMMDRPAGPPVRSYRTSFPTDENPILERAIWLNGRQDGIDWADVITRNGEVYGAVTRMAVAERRAEQGNLDPAAAGSAPEGDYDDPTAVLAGVW